MSGNTEKLSFAAPNGSAFVVTESRHGPPLNFVGDKLRQSLIYTHMTYVSVITYIPNDFPQPLAWHGTDFSVRTDGLLEPIRSTFRNQLTAFLAMYNMLALDGDDELVNRMLTLSSTDFRTWVDRIASAGSVTG